MRLLIIRDECSPILEHIELDDPNVKIALVQNGVYSEKLRGKNSLSLDADVAARKLEIPADKKINYDGLLDAIFAADNVLVV